MKNSMVPAVLMLVGLAGCHPGKAPQARTPVRIAVPLDPITYFPLYLARELGSYREEGLEYPSEQQRN
jgi:ABC-type nitrate/sulfonate/bicarbonate transport system substrate-binding protein